MSRLDDMALFVEVMKARSFRGAAESLGMPNSTLSRRISLLEQSIGLRLLNRTTRSIEPTEAGQLYFERASRIIDEARIAHEELGDMVARPVGTLRVSLPVDFATTWLAPLLPELAQLYPGLDFDLDLTPRNVDLIAEPFDLAIRMAQPEGAGLIARVIGRLTPFLYASPTYLADHGEPSHPSELAARACLAMPRNGVWRLNAGDQSVDVAASSRFRANSVAMLRRLAVQDMGVLFAPDRVVAEEVANGRLVRILADWQGPPALIYAITATRLVPARTQRFIDFLKQNLKDDAEARS
ncbi:LysR family transcriptional regulator [Caulobacter sp. D4A]|uniref:LysR family transcriptional regulator n=1 Tax=unclassified Caulobacter TaxID=2648921 RepID=UPI000D736E27|nr:MULTISPECIES: LysR family transcriptional regulator [unclassified Caulobacter]PXA78742.1 LysR family transcriptional regulator [Caulobacter sp. D4A]PXA88727.1 LysR family transcriptional regulator [Caulobacter sp. D5]